ncbi:MAG: hypothetical protein HYX34_11785 [Actinobacteria bacterium]|nr:hypothetical protein [Actinomycetota bacterium]
MRAPAPVRYATVLVPALADVTGSSGHDRLSASAAKCALPLIAARGQDRWRAGRGDK